MPGALAGAEVVMRARALAFVAAGAFLAGSLAKGARGAAAPTPLGIHVAYGKDPTTQMTISWHTAPDAVAAGALVEYGTSPSLGTTAAATSARAPALPPPLASTLHEATLTGLEPATTYHYRVGDGSLWSPTWTFRTVEPDDGSFSFVAMGDHGQSAQAQATTAFVEGLDASFVAIAGDVSYANSALEEWDVWTEQVEPLAARTPLMAAPGNHDTQEGNPLGYLARFAYPDGELYYSFDHGRAHFLMLHSTYGAAGARDRFAAQIPFAEADLADAARRRANGEIDWIFVVQHHPLYANMDTVLGSRLQERNYNPPLIAWEERLLQQYDVDVLIVGHNHHYERTYPMVAGQPTSSSPGTYTDPTGYIEVVTGGAGAGLYDFRAPEDFASFSAAHAQRHHVVVFDVDGKTLRARAVATGPGAGEVLDTFTITRT